MSSPRPSAACVLRDDLCKKKPAAGKVTLPRGVTVRPSGKWQCQIYYAGKSRYIGVFESREDACYAYEVGGQVLMTCNDPKDNEVDANINLARKAAFAGVGGNVAKNNKYRYECSADGCANVTCFSSIKSALDNHRNEVLSLLWQTAAEGENLASYASLLYRVREETVAALRDANFLSPTSKALSEAEDDAGRLFSQTKEAVEEALESLEDEHKEGDDNRRKSVELLESINRRANREESPSPSILGVGSDGQCGTMSVVLANTYMPPPGHHYGPPPPHPQAGGGYPSRPHLPPRFNHHQQYDPSYAAGPPQKQPSSPGESQSQNGAYPSPATVTTMDSRSPEGSRNDVGNLEERVSSNNGNPPPPPPHYSPASAPSMPPPMGYHPGYPPHHYAHHQYHSPHAPNGWACDFCNSKFNNWEECSAHEESCAAKSYYDGRNSHKNAKGRKMRLASFPTDFYMDHNAEYAVNDDRETYLLTTDKDKDSLSDRQCYVRSHFVEVFVANNADMTARHSRGAQKLNEDQIGLRCAYCVKLKPRDRAKKGKVRLL